MHRTDAEGNAANLFTDGNPATGTPATVVDAAWLNAVQEEIIAILTAAGIAPVKDTNNQTLAAILALINNGAGVIPLRNYWYDPDATPSSVIDGANANAKMVPIKLPSGSTTGIIGYATLANHLLNYRLLPEIKMSAAQSSKNIVLRVALRALVDGEDPTTNTWDVDTTQVIAARNDAMLQTISNAAFQIGGAFLHNDFIMVKVGLWRLGAHASNTHTGDLYLQDPPIFKAV